MAPPSLHASGKRYTWVSRRGPRDLELAPGLSDYGYHLGLRRLDFGIAGFSYGPPALLARHRVGITEQLFWRQGNDWRWRRQS